MSTPQKELGHVKIATGTPENDVLSALGSAQLTGVEYQIVLYVIRKTWGFNKKNGWITAQQFVDFTGRTEEGVYKAIRSLREKNILHTEQVMGKPTIYGFNKDFRSWEGVYYSSGVNKSGGVNKSKEGGERQFGRGANASSPTKGKHTKAKIKANPTGAVAPAPATPGFLPPRPMDNDLKADLDDSPPPPKRKNVRTAFSWSDDSELVRVMKQTCGLTTLDNGKKPQDNFARHILVKLYKILTEDYGRTDQDALDHIRANMEEFCALVQRARDTDQFMWRKLTTLKSIYYELPAIFEMAKKRPSKSTSHLSV